MNKEVRMIIILASLTAVIFGLSIFVSITASKTEPKLETDQVVVEEPSVVIEVEATVEDEVIEEEKEIPRPESVNILTIGFDESGGLTDVMMVFHLDTETKEVSAVSIPRDLLIDFRTDRFRHIKQNNPENGLLYCKLNEVYSYSGWDEQALYDVREIISIIIGRDIDYMVTIDISGFEKIVDAIGGVDFYVPQDMNYYDPAADFLIDLDEGQQILDGNHALQLVRYRKGYTMGDLQRIKVQQDFILATADEIFNEIQLSELIQLVGIGYDIVETDFGLTDVMSYVNYLYDVDIRSLLNSDRIDTVPNAGQKIDGFWFQILDEEGAIDLVDDLF